MMNPLEAFRKHRQARRELAALGTPETPDDVQAAADIKKIIGSSRRALALWIALAVAATGAFTGALVVPKLTKRKEVSSMVDTITDSKLRDAKERAQALKLDNRNSKLLEEVEPAFQYFTLKCITAMEKNNDQQAARNAASVLNYFKFFARPFLYNNDGVESAKFQTNGDYAFKASNPVSDDLKEKWFAEHGIAYYDKPKRNLGINYYQTKAAGEPDMKALLSRLYCMDIFLALSDARKDRLMQPYMPELRDYFPSEMSTALPQGVEEEFEKRRGKEKGQLSLSYVLDTLRLSATVFISSTGLDQNLASDERAKLIEAMMYRYARVFIYETATVATKDDPTTPHLKRLIENPQLLTAE